MHGFCKVEFGARDIVGALGLVAGDGGDAHESLNGSVLVAIGKDVRVELDVRSGVDEVQSHGGEDGEEERKMEEETRCLFEDKEVAAWRQIKEEVLGSPGCLQALC